MILKRYVIMEILKPAAAILFVLVIIFASYTAVTYLSEAVAGSLPPGTVGMMILLRIGMALEVLLPTTFYLSVIIALGRLYKDSEMTALSACGVGITGVLKPVALLSLPVAVLAGWASLSIRPQSYVEIYRIKAQAQVEFDISRLEPDNFLDLENGKYVFFAESVKEPRARGRAGSSSGSKEGSNRKVIQAERMIQGPEDETGAKKLLFSNGTFYEFPVAGEGGKISRFNQAEYPMPNDAPERALPLQGRPHPRAHRVCQPGGHLGAAVAVLDAVVHHPAGDRRGAVEQEQPPARQVRQARGGRSSSSRSTTSCS